ncbi:hypothetical protein GCK72_006895 [Caenorhabditis remanei]|uniref:Uncharacterized protein n=1 Tax=Caenorhabditis remanei TaxID=31234 RepID=A0A6A5HK20_CAERE|nr:hypothetical protein GCK72_006895 [Caenorhabditis remanei]KAF1766937.1 hypothetical protein GCK72_006895 [Caenorhabditis remanei]
MLCDQQGHIASKCPTRNTLIQEVRVAPEIQSKIEDQKFRMKSDTKCSSSIEMLRSGDKKADGLQTSCTKSAHAKENNVGMNREFTEANSQNNGNCDEDQKSERDQRVCSASLLKTKKQNDQQKKVSHVISSFGDLKRDRKEQNIQKSFVNCDSMQSSMSSEDGDGKKKGRTRKLLTMKYLNIRFGKDDHLGQHVLHVQIFQFIPLSGTLMDDLNSIVSSFKSPLMNHICHKIINIDDGEVDDGGILLNEPLILLESFVGDDEELGELQQLISLHNIVIVGSVLFLRFSIEFLEESAEWHLRDDILKLNVTVERSRW